MYENVLKIRKKYKKENLLLDAYFENYSGCNVYIRLDYDKKNKIHKLSWFDLNYINMKKIDDYKNTELIAPEIINTLAEIIKNSKLDIGLRYKDKEVRDGLVDFNLYFYKKKKQDRINIIFHRYVPKELSFLYNIFDCLFFCLPKSLDWINKELGAIINKEDKKYDYKKNYYVDIYKDKMLDIFTKRDIKKGTEIYESGKVAFLEKIKDKYYAFIEGKTNTSVVLFYDDKEKVLRVYSSCKKDVCCYHIYAVILAIRNKFKRKFYKVTHCHKSDDIIQNAANFNYFICAGIKDSKLILINNYGNIEYANILDEENNLIWKVIEDDNDKTLTNMLNDL